MRFRWQYNSNVIANQSADWCGNLSPNEVLCMELIVAVYDDWGIGKDGTQPIALSADRKFFR